MLSDHQLAETITTPEARLSTVATSLYGEGWAQPVARLTGIALRTCQRVQASIRDGQSDERASSLLAALSNRLAVLGASCSPAEENLAFEECDPGATRSFVARMQKRIGSIEHEDEGREFRAVSLWDADISQLLRDAAHLEGLLWQLVKAATAVDRDDASAADYEAFSTAVYDAMWELNVPAVQTVDGLWSIYGPPEPRYDLSAGPLNGIAVDTRPVLAMLTPDEHFVGAIIAELAKDPAVKRAYQPTCVSFALEVGGWHPDHHPVVAELCEEATAAIRERLSDRLAAWKVVFD